ncbi:MAG: FAD-dependent oxidoreductase [Clostridiales bacterium]|nr:FAD-dependent oxidoreductase [Clostridiales bacterium]MDU3244124.1 FAD-dependent oxidoreductase [Clostridiales bacterium]
METLELKKNLYWTGIKDKDLRVFDIIMETEFGTTYNSYLIKGSEKTALFETAKFKFFDTYLAELKQLVDINKIDYIIVDHTEPDHAGSVEKLIEMNPNIKIVGTAVAISFLKNIVNRDFYSIPVKENDTLSLGDKTLHFMILPNLHWPDTMYTYVEEDKVLVTCDSFGSHYTFDGVLRSQVTDEEGYMTALKYYFDNIIGPFKPYMLKALKRIENLDIDMICTGHGPVLDSKIPEILDTYLKWSTVINPNQEKTVVIPYVSAYGYTAQIAEEIARGIRESGNIDVHLHDCVTSDQAEVLADIGFADGILFGTPTIVGEALKPIWDLTTSMFACTHGGKLASAFGSYGWSGEGVNHIVERLKQLRMKVVDGLRIKFKPGKNDLIEAYDYGYDFGCILLDKENPRVKEKSAKKLVKCLVCGEIFEEGIEICPVCGVGKENFVPVEVEEVSYRKDTSEFYLILGNGAAGVSAAEAIRERNKTCSIVMVSNESVLSYNRPMLTKSMLASFNPSQLAIHDEQWYQERNIINVLDKTVQSMDTQLKEVVFADGLKLKYDKCIYALGSECFVPPIPGHDKDQVVAIRRLSDVVKIGNMLPDVKHAVVIGGGVLGLEAAWELSKAKCQVTIVEVANQLMGRQLDAGASDMLKDIILEKKMAIRMGANVEEIEGEGAVTGVRLAGGEVIPADLVIVSAGVRASTKVAQEAGIQTDRAIVVDEKMHTNLTDIYACGDCAQYKGINYAIWPQALEMGKVAGANAAGDSLTYETVNAALTFHGMDTALFAIGDNGKNADIKYKTVEFKDPMKMVYEKYYFSNNRLCGAILLGDTSKMAKVTVQVEEHTNFKDMF